MTKKKIRVGDRGQVTKLIMKINDELEKNIEERGGIESLCETLKKKRDILLKLDDEILEEIDKDNIQAEIEEADRYT